MGRNPLINRHEYEFLTGMWQGVKGAAYNQCYEYCLGNGLVTRHGDVTPLGRQTIEEYQKYDQG